MPQLRFPDGSHTTVDGSPESLKGAWREWHLAKGNSLPADLLTNEELVVRLSEVERQLSEALGRLATAEEVGVEAIPDAPLEPQPDQGPSTEPVPAAPAEAESEPSAPGESATAEPEVAGDLDTTTPAEPESTASPEANGLPG